MSQFPEYENMTADRLHTVLQNIEDRITTLENADRLGFAGQQELSQAIDRRTYLRAHIDEMVWGQTQRRDDPDIRAALQRIMRKAEIMRMDAKTRGDHRIAGDANEIELLARIALRGIGGEHVA
jgi:hypothetical protein